MSPWSTVSPLPSAPLDCDTSEKDTFAVLGLSDLGVICCSSFSAVGVRRPGSCDFGTSRSMVVSPFAHSVPLTSQEAGWSPGQGPCGTMVTQTFQRVVGARLLRE